MTTAQPQIPQRSASEWRSIAGVDEAVRYLTAMVEGKHPGCLERLSVDPREEMQSWAEIRVSLVPGGDKRTIDSGCSTSGMYLAGGTRPTLLAADSLSEGRVAFTFLHELGHHLQRTNSEWMFSVLSKFRGQQAVARFEHRVCDEFASQTLMPEALVAAHIKERDSISASTLVQFRNSTSVASREAAIMRLGRYASPHSAILLVDPDRALTFSRAHGDLAPPKRGTELDQPLIARAQRQPQGEVTGDLVFRYSTGAEFTVDATASADASGYVYVVAQEAQNTWLTSPWRPGTIDCLCGAEYTVRESLGNCPRCNKPICPECEVCRRHDSEAKTCARCFTALSVSEVSRGRIEHDDC